MKFVQCQATWCGGVFRHPVWPEDQRLSEMTCPDCGHECVFERADLFGGMGSTPVAPGTPSPFAAAGVQPTGGSGSPPPRPDPNWQKNGDQWAHRPWWKVAINTVLRRLQRGRPSNWLVYTRSTVDGDPPTVLGYGFGRIPMRSS